MDLAVVGHMAKDRSFRLGKTLFEALSVKVEEKCVKISELECKGIPCAQLIKMLEENSIEKYYYHYGGRAANVAYQCALLGLPVVLVSEAGGDLDFPYSGFYDGSYRSHLEKSGVDLRLKVVESEERWRKMDQTSVGTVLCTEKETPEVICITDVEHRNLYFIKDVGAATSLAKGRKPPIQILKEVKAVFVTSGRLDFNVKVMRAAKDLGKELYWDVGFYDLKESYVRGAVGLVDKLFCNPAELKEMCRISGISPRELAPLVVVHDKRRGTAKVYEGKQVKSFAFPISRKVNPVGCCDAFSAAFTSYDLQGKDVETCVLAGLVASASVYGTSDIHSGMLKKEELELKLSHVKSYTWKKS